jgi:phospholipid/cholesterol/gamma-HCH transport system substrate-binding protein
MGRRAYAILTGIFLTVFTSGLVASMVFLRGCSVTRSPYLVVADVPVSGLRPGAEIFYRGVTAGVVDSLRVDRRDPRRILVRILVDPDIPVTATSFATLRTEGVTGSRRLHLDVGAPAAPLSTSDAAPARIPLRPSLLDQVGDRLGEVLPRIEELVANLNLIVGPDNRARVERILANTEVATARLVTLERNLDHRLGRALAGVPGLVDDGRTTVKRVDTLVADLSRLAQRLDGVTREASALTAATRSELREGTLPRLRVALDQVAQTGATLEQLSRRIQADPRAFLFGPPRSPPGPGERGHRWPRR